MIWILITLGVVIALFLIFFFILSSEIDIKLENIKIESGKPIATREFSIIVFVKALGKIPLFTYTLPTQKWITKIKDKEWEQKNIKTVQNLGGFSFLREVQKLLKIRLRKLHLKATIGIEDAVLTSLLVGILGAILSILLPKVAIPGKEKNYYYEIQPNFHKNMYKIDLDCIISVKMVHIISVIYMVFKKKGEKKHERTSNRRSYEYGYEQY